MLADWPKFDAATFHNTYMAHSNVCRKSRKSWIWNWICQFIEPPRVSHYNIICTITSVISTKFLYCICSDFICTISCPSVGSADDSIPGQPYEDSSCLRGETI